MSANTKAATFNILIEQLKRAQEDLDRGLEVAEVIQLIEKFECLGDVGAQIQTAEKILPLLRSLRTTRAQPTLDTLMKRLDSLRRARESLTKLGNLSRLADQIAALEEARAELLQPHDMSTLIKQVEGLGPKLDALGELIECLKTWEPW